MTTTIEAAEDALQNRLISQMQADLERLPHLDAADKAIASELSLIQASIRSSVCDALSLRQIESLGNECAARASSAAEPQRSHLTFIQGVCYEYLEDSAA